MIERFLPKRGNYMDQGNSQLVIRDVPIGIWLLGLLFAGVGIAICLTNGPPLLLGLLFVAVGLGLLLFISASTITADRMTRTLKLVQRSVLRQSRKEMPFSDIAGINVQRRRTSGKGGPTYQLTLLRANGEVVPFASYSSSGWKSKEKKAVRLREFIGIQDNQTPPGILPPELARGSQLHETAGVHWQIQPMTTYSANAPTGGRWHSPDFKTPGTFLFLAQKAEGQSSSGFLASLGSMFIRQALSIHGFQPEDTPGLDRASTLGPLDPALESHFMAYTNSPEAAQRLLNSKVVAQLAAWAGRYPLKQFQSGSNYCQLVVLFGPTGVYAIVMHMLQPSQAHELVALGVALVKETR
jgi:hypothetical protein